METSAVKTNEFGHHIVAAFDDDLDALAALVADMGESAREQVESVADAIDRRDRARADVAVARDGETDRIQRLIEDKATLVISKRQPMAADVRFVLSAVKIANDLERVGDLAKNNAQRIKAILGGDERGVEEGLPSQLGEMGRLALAQLEKAMRAFKSKNPDAVRNLWKQDGKLDVLFGDVFRSVVGSMSVSESPDLIVHDDSPLQPHRSAHVMFVAKNFERIGDHCTNVAEYVHFWVTGEMPVEDEPHHSTDGTLKPPDAD